MVIYAILPFQIVQYIYVSLQLRVQNQMKKWHFPLNFRNGIN